MENRMYNRYSFKEFKHIMSNWMLGRFVGNVTANIVVSGWQRWWHPTPLDRHLHGHCIPRAAGRIISCFLIHPEVKGIVRVIVLIHLANEELTTLMYSFIRYKQPDESRGNYDIVLVNYTVQIGETIWNTRMFQFVYGNILGISYLH